MVGATALARLPLGMLPLALVLSARSSGISYVGAGVATATFSTGVAVGQPLLGRVVDTHGSRALTRLSGAFAASCLALALVDTTGHTQPAVLIALAALVGATLPPTGAAMRAAWPTVVGCPALLRTAYAFESSAQELVFIGGPLLTGAIAQIGAPFATILVAGGCGVSGTTSFARASSAHLQLTSRAAPLRPYRLPGVRTLMLVTIAFIGAYGTIEVSMPAFAQTHRSDAAAGGLPIAALALGALTGGIITARASAVTASTRYRLGLACCVAGTSTLLLARSVPAMTAATFIAGLPIGTVWAGIYELVGRLTEHAAQTEAFALLTTCATLGGAFGATLAGTLIRDFGVTAAMSAPAVCLALALALAQARRWSLTSAIE